MIKKLAPLFVFAFSALAVNAQVEMVENQNESIDALFDNEEKDIQSDYYEKQYRFKPTQNLFRFGYGMGTILSKVYNEYGNQENYSTNDYQIDYEHVWKSGRGFGINFAKSIIDGGPSEKGGFSFVYFGASYVLDYMTTAGWNWSFGIGLGYAGYSDHYKNLNGIGFLCNASCDYKITRNIGIGADLRLRTDRYGTPEGVTLQKDESFGFNTLSLMIGPRFYF